MTTTTAEDNQRKLRIWQVVACFLFLVSTGLLIALIIVVTRMDNDDDDDNGGSGMMIKTCGRTTKNPLDDINLSEPSVPGPFHDLTETELLALREYLVKDRNINAFNGSFPPLGVSAIFAADLHLPPKSDVLRYLDSRGSQPPREARVMMFRGDLRTPVAEQYICGPLPEINACRLMALTGRRNPAQFSVRPYSATEFYFINEVILQYLEKELGYILRASYGTSFKDCGSDGLCLGVQYSPLGTGILGNIDSRKIWLGACYQIEQKNLHALDFGALVDLSGKDAYKWSIISVWYAGRLYNSVDDLITGYNASSIPRSNVKKPSSGPDLFSRMNMKSSDKPWPDPGKRPPKLVEPDGKRYKVKDRKVEYMDWSFHFRLSSFSGPALNDVRFKGERIVYDMGLQELSVFYSAYSPIHQTTNYMDTAALLGSNARALVPGADCPDIATFVGQKFMAQFIKKVAHYRRAMCLFENNSGYPLRRHLEHRKSQGAVYTGMLDSALTMRTIMTIGNYDYILDFIFHQNGVLETRWMSSGFILSNFYTNEEKDYAFRLHGFRSGPLHLHLAHFKVDLDVSGTSNRYQTLDIVPHDVKLNMNKSLGFQTTKFTRNVHETELGALYKHNFDQPKVHLFHKDKVKNENDEIKAYRIEIEGMAKQLRNKRLYNEVVIPWARHQLAVTRQKDHEFWSSSPYAMWDSADPVVDFGSFYDDNDNITDQDLVAWISMGADHIPRTEDIPVTSTLGNHRGFLITPFNYYPQCPSQVSRDAIRLTHKDVSKPEEGIRIERNGNSDDQCVTSKSDLEQDLERDPDSVLETNELSPII